MRLIEHSNTRANLIRTMKKNPLGKTARALDLSQKKNGNSAFRNEIFNGKEIQINNSFATPLPRMGTLSFDFSGGALPNRDDMICSDQRVVKILGLLHLLDTSQEAVDKAVIKLDRYKHLSELCMQGNGRTLYEASWERGLKIGDHLNDFYDNQLERLVELDASREQEEILVNVLNEQELYEDCNDEDIYKAIHGHNIFDLDHDEVHGLGSLLKSSLHNTHKHGDISHTVGVDDHSVTSLGADSQTASLVSVAGGENQSIASGDVGSSQASGGYVAGGWRALLDADDDDDDDGGM